MRLIFVFLMLILFIPPHIIAEGENYFNHNPDCTEELSLFNDAEFTFENVPCTYTVNFTSTAPGSENFTHLWLFENEGTDETENPSFTFPGPGTYTVTHMINWQTNPVIFVQEVNVPEVKPFGDALFEYSVRHCGGSSVVSFFSYNESGTHLWNFGDGQEGTGFYPEHTYQSGGDYMVTHTVIFNECTYERTFEVIVNPACLSFGQDGQITYMEDIIGTTSDKLPTLKAEELSICFHGTIVMTAEVGVYSFNKCNIKMSPGSKIIVNPGARLSIGARSTIYACDNMWQGIEVKGGGHLRIMENSFIEDAQYALYLNNSSKILLNCFFNRNYIGIYMPPSGSLQSVQLENPINGVRFFCNDALNAPYNNANGIQQYEPGLPAQGTRSYAAILLNDLNLFTIGSTAFTSVFVADHANGFIFDNVSKTVVQGFNMRNILETAEYPGQSGRGIHCIGTGTQELLERGSGIINEPTYPLSDMSNNFFFFPFAFENVTTGIFADGVGVKASNNR